jgi:hypothetical protein
LLEEEPLQEVPFFTAQERGMLRVCGPTNPSPQHEPLSRSCFLFQPGSQWIVVNPPLHEAESPGDYDVRKALENIFCFFLVDLFSIW